MKVLFALAALFAAVTAIPQNCNFECSNGECCFEEAACGTPGCNERRRFCKICHSNMSTFDLMTNSSG